jgi:hypothetical protein
MLASNHRQWGPIALPQVGPPRWFSTLHVVFRHAGAIAAVAIFPLNASLAAIALVSYVVRFWGMEGVYHRYFWHRSYRASRGVQLALALIGTQCGQRGPLWCIYTACTINTPTGRVIANRQTRTRSGKRTGTRRNHDGPTRFNTPSRALEQRQASKAPLRVRDIWAIRVRLHVQHRTRDLALFDLGIDSKLRALYPPLRFRAAARRKLWQAF